jgi:hypothetical protein
MRKKIFWMILIGLALLSFPKTVLAQDSDKVMILSPRVGSVIDGAERERYQLFQEIRGFDRAVFLQTPKKTYYAKIMFVGPDGKRRDTTVQYSEDSLSVLAERIDHFEDFKGGTYHAGDRPAKIQLADSIKIMTGGTRAYGLQEQNKLRQLAERAAEHEESLPKVYAQDSDKVVILSPRIESVIDAAKRERYDLFPGIKGFDRAVFLQTPEKTYYARIVFIGPEGTGRDTMVQYSEDTLLVLAERIEHFEELKQKTYHIGERPAKIRVLERRFKPEVAAAPWTQGTDVVILLVSGQEVEGELVSVRDSSVLIAVDRESIPPGLPPPIQGILAIKDTLVSHVVVEGSSHVLLGTGLGLVAGVVGGGAIGAASYSPQPPPNPKGPFEAIGVAVAYPFVEGARAGSYVVGGMLIGAVVGALVGAGVGAATSKSDIEVNLFVPAERSALKKVARYPDKEPKALERIK